LAEPVKDWQSDLEMNRSARIFNLAVTNRSNDRIEMLVSESLEVSSLAEPRKDWQSDLEMNRSARIFNLAVTNRSNDRIEMLVSESLEVSSLAEFNEDYLSDYRSKHSRVEYVETISLNDLLLQGNAPNDIDFLSIDTEGNEFQILESFNFEGYSFAFISIEHNNNNNNRNRIQELLESKGYEKVHQNISSVDDWYVPNPLSKIMPKTF